MFYLIWTFDPISTSSYDSILDALSDFLETHALMDPNSPYTQVMQANGLPLVAKSVHSFSRTLDAKLKQAGKNIETFFDNLGHHNNYIADTEFVNEFGQPWTAPKFDASTHVVDLLYGIANGAIDVFPFSSNPNRCRNNITQTW